MPIDYSKYGAQEEQSASDNTSTPIDYSKYNAEEEQPNSIGDIASGYTTGGPAGAASQYAVGKFLAPGTSSILSNPENAVLGAGDAIRNLFSAGLIHDHTGSGSAYNVGNALGTAAGFLGGGELLGAARGAAEAIPYAGKVAQALGGEGYMGSLRRILGSAAGGAALNPDNRLKGAGEGAVGGVAGEALPALMQTSRNVSEFLDPRNYASKIATNIRNTYKGFLDKASQFYDPVIEKFGNKNIYDNSDLGKNVSSFPSEYSNASSDPNINQYYGPNIQKLQRTFFNKPTFQNAHDLQSQLGDEIRQLEPNRSNAITKNAIEALTQSREALRNDMFSYLGARDKNSLLNYKSGTDYFALFPSAYRANDTLRSIAEGKVKTIDPNMLQNAIKPLIESESIHPSHPLNQNYQDITSKINRGSMGGDLASIGSGMVLGHFAGGPIGAVAGGLAGKFLGPAAMRLARNPEMNKAMGYIKPLYLGGYYGTLANLLKPKEVQKGNENGT